MSGDLHPTGASGIVVAIDGPSGTAYLDTGAMYRAATWWCLEEGIDLADQAAVAAAVDVMPLVMGIDPAAPSVHVGGTDVGEAIRTTEISTAVSAVATNLAVRAELRRLQRVIIAAESSASASASSASSAEGGDTSFSGGRGVVAEGRDITTVVAPDADVRILLTASEEARLARRSLEVHGAADDAAVEATKDQVLRRDRDDSTVSQFHVAADGVVTVDSSDLDFEQTVQAVLDVVDRVTATAAAGGEGTAR